MTTPEIALAERLKTAMTTAFGPELADADPTIRPSQFADFQCNAAMGLAKRLGMRPRDIAQRIVEAADLDDLAEPLEIAGPGFINVRLRTDWIQAQVGEMASEGGLGVPRPDAQRVVVDYSAPNVAKEMHVGHLRTSVVGDSLVRVLERLGHTVVRQNHIGDWGTPFGMLIEHLLDVGEDSAQAHLLVTDPNAFYQAARAAFDSDPEFAARARARVATLQSGDAETLAIWTRLVSMSTAYFHRIYDTLGVTLTDDDLAGESTYNDDLPAVCEDLESRGIATVSDGALCVFPAGFTGRDEQPLPLIVRKSDGGYGYATTDLAAVRRRVGDLRADRIAYVVGTSQELHFQMVLTAAREAGYLPDSVEAVHVKIGSVLGPDGKILRTRSGDSVRLMALLEEAIAHAREVIDDLRPDLGDDERAEIARMVGVGSVKYADLSTAHDSDYTFDLDRMLALSGNTAPYLQYAVARIRSILRRAAEQGLGAGTGAPRVVDPAERALALRLLEFGPTVEQVAGTLEPHRLAALLFQTAQSFTAFYEACPILKESDPQVRAGRLALAELTGSVLVEGLGLLGIEAPSRM